MWLKNIVSPVNVEDNNRENNFKNQLLDLSYFVGKKYFDSDGSQNYLIFQPVFKFFQIFSGAVNKILGWKSKRLSDKSSTTSATWDNSFAWKCIFIILK